MTTTRTALEKVQDVMGKAAAARCICAKGEWCLRCYMVLRGEHYPHPTTHILAEHQDCRGTGRLRWQLMKRCSGWTPVTLIEMLRKRDQPHEDSCCDGSGFVVRTATEELFRQLAYERGVRVVQYRPGGVVLLDNFWEEWIGGVGETGLDALADVLGKMRWEAQK